jgi:anaerobic magnesium-protoporphyrin IX monomethyl ester cyclase
MRVLLLEPVANTAPWEYSISSRENLGLGYLAACLRRVGHEVAVASGPALGWCESDLADCIADFRPRVLGVSLQFTDELVAALTVLSSFKDLLGPGMHVLAGGHAAAASARAIFSSLPAISAIVRGEGEETVVEALGALEIGRDLHTVRGLILPGPDGPVSTPARPLIANLDELPFPDRDILKQQRALGIGPSEVYVSASRGCPFRCSFCSVKTFYANGSGLSWRGRSPENVVAELQRLAAEFGESPTYCFVDDQFIGPGRRGQERAQRIANLIVDSGLKLSLEVTCRADTLTRETLLVLKEAGLSMVYLGLDSGSPLALERYRKDLIPEENLDAVKLLLDLGIGVDFGFIMFDPWMSLADVRWNLLFLRRLVRLGVPLHPSVLLNSLKLYPGTPIAARVPLSAPPERALEGRLPPKVQEFREQLKEALTAFGDHILDPDAGEPLIERLLALLEANDRVLPTVLPTLGPSAAPC